MSEQIVTSNDVEGSVENGSGTVRLFVNNLAYKASEDDLKPLFEGFEILGLKLPKSLTLMPEMPDTCENHGDSMLVRGGDDFRIAP